MNLTLTIIGAALLAAAGTLVYLIAVPRKDAIPLSRRRLKPQVSALTVAANATTTLLQRLITGRESKLSETLFAASLKVKPVDFLLWVIAIILAGTALGSVFGGALLGLAGGVVALIGVWLYLRLRTGKRKKMIAKQMIDTLNTIAGALRSGSSLPQAIGLVAEEADAPTSEEFTRVVNETRIGYDLSDALAGLAARAGNEDLEWVVRAININRDVGGSLAETMDGVAETIRQRAELRMKVKAMSAEGKMSAYILGALPFVVAVAVSFMSPGYLTPLFTSVLGYLLLGVAAVMLTIGLFWMSRMIKIKY